jgi:hypothetical protein
MKKERLKRPCIYIRQLRFRRTICIDFEGKSVSRSSIAKIEFLPP